MLALKPLLLILLSSLSAATGQVLYSENTYQALLPPDSCDYYAGFTDVNNGCYFVNNTKATWSEANSTCHEIGGHLLALDLHTETVAMYYWLKKSGLVDYWIDAKKVGQDYQWTWSGRKVERDTTLRQLNDTYWSRDDEFLFLHLKYLSDNSTIIYELHSAPNDETRKKGFICEAKIDCLESQNVCMNDAKCYVNSARVFCVCPPGFTGALCEIMIDHCSYAPCKHGDCQSLVDSYACSCWSEFQGANCELEMPQFFKEARSSALIASLAVVGVAILILCLCDLPWERFHDKRQAKHQLKKAAARLSQIKDLQFRKPKAKANQDWDYANYNDEQMIRRFKSAIVSQRQGSGSQVSIAVDGAAELQSKPQSILSTVLKQKP